MSVGKPEGQSRVKKGDRLDRVGSAWGPLPLRSRPTMHSSLDL